MSLELVCSHGSRSPKEDVNEPKKVGFKSVDNDCGMEWATFLHLAPALATFLGHERHGETVMGCRACGIFWTMSPCLKGVYGEPSDEHSAGDC